MRNKLLDQSMSTHFGAFAMFSVRVLIFPIRLCQLCLCIMHNYTWKPL